MYNETEAAIMAERAYRRGFQQGYYCGMQDDRPTGEQVFKWRHAPITKCTPPPMQRGVTSSLVERHIIMNLFDEES